MTETMPVPGARRVELRSAMGPLMQKLWAAAAHGSVARTVFEEAVGPLGLDAAALARLEAGVQALGLSIAPREVQPPLAPVPQYVTLAAAAGQDASVVPPDDPARVQEAEAVAAARRRLDADRWLTDEAKQRHLLTAQEEIGLSLLLHGWPDQPGDAALEEAELAALPVDDVRRLAYEAFVVHNLKLAHKVCQGLATHLLPYEDMLHHAVLGLMHAVWKFDPAAGFKFSTYAVHWLRQSTGRATADFGSIIRIPVHMHEDVRKVAAVEARLRGQGRLPSAVDIAVEAGLPVGKVTEVRRISRVTDSLDREIVDGSNLGDLLSASHAVPPPEEELRHKWSRQDIEQRLLGRLTTREADILRRRAGLVDGEKQTLDEIGMHYGITRERIRQVESKARDQLLAILNDDAS